MRRAVEQLKAGAVIGPEITSPQPRFHVRRVAGVPALEERPPPLGAEGRHVDAVAAEPELAGRAQVAEQAHHHRLIPAVLAEHRRRGRRAQQQARVVVAVVRGEPGAGLDAPGDQPVGAVIRITPATLARVGFKKIKIEQLAGDLPVRGGGAEMGAQGQRHRRLGMAVAAADHALDLAAIGEDLRQRSLENPERSVADRRARRRGGSARRDRVGGHHRVDFRDAIRVQQQFRAVEPLGAAQERLPFDLRGKRVMRAVGRAHGRRPCQRRRFLPGQEPFQDATPHRRPGLPGRVTRGDKLAEFGGGHHHRGARQFEEQRRHRRVVQPEHRGVKAGHPRRHQVRAGGIHRQIVQPVDRQNSQRRETRSEKLRADHRAVIGRGGPCADRQPG